MKMLAEFQAIIHLQPEHVEFLRQHAVFNARAYELYYPFYGVRGLTKRTLNRKELAEREVVGSVCFPNRMSFSECIQLQKYWFLSGLRLSSKGHRRTYNRLVPYLFCPRLSGLFENSDGFVKALRTRHLLAYRNKERRSEHKGSELPARYVQFQPTAVQNDSKTIE